MTVRYFSSFDISTTTRYRPGGTSGDIRYAPFWLIFPLETSLVSASFRGKNKTVPKRRFPLHRYFAGNTNKFFAGVAYRFPARRACQRQERQLGRENEEEGWRGRSENLPLHMSHLRCFVIEGEMDHREIYIISENFGNPPPEMQSFTELSFANSSRSCLL